MTDILKMVLEEENYEVQLARDGKDGYLAYLLFKPDTGSGYYRYSDAGKKWFEIDGDHKDP